MQKLTIIGNLGQDAQEKAFSDGKKVINFTVAVSNGKTKDGTERPSSWFNCQLWIEKDQSSKRKDHLKSGTKVYLEGIPKAEAYLDKEGKAVSSIVLVVSFVELLSAQKPTEQNEQ
jgi:single-strand DNA-binding protein